MTDNFEVENVIPLPKSPKLLRYSPFCPRMKMFWQVS